MVRKLAGAPAPHEAGAPGFFRRMGTALALRVTRFPTSPAGPSLHGTLIRRLALAAMVPVALLGVGELVSAYRTERLRLTDQLQMSTVLLASSVDEFVQAHLSAVTLVANTPRYGTPWEPHLERLRAQYPAVRTSLVTDAQGNILESSPPLNAPNRRVQDREYFQVPARTRTPYLSNAFMGRGFGTDPLVAVSAPLFADGRFAGVVEGSIGVESFTRMRSEELRRRGFEMLILDREGHVVHASPGLSFEFDQDLSGAPFLRRSAGDGATIGRALGVVQNEPGAFVAQTSTHAGWSVLLLAPDSAIDGPLKRRLSIFLGMLVLAVLGTWWVVAMQMRRFAELQQSLLGALHRVATRQAVEPLDLDEIPVELRPLAQSIDGLAHQLDSAQDDNVELDRLTRTDALTAVLNRRGFDERLEQLVDGGDSVLRVPVAVLAVDIDHFKQYNDRYGHLAGDTALRRVAGAISGCLRGEDDLVARTGGEEFVALLMDADALTAYGVAERARHAVAALGIPHAKSPTGCLTISVGVHVAPAGAHPLALVEQADQALYRAKRGGRDRVAL